MAQTQQKTAKTSQSSQTANQKQHQPAINEDLHMALKSCVEIGSSKTLYTFVQDVLLMSQQIYGAASERVVPSAVWQRFIQNEKLNKKFVGFLRSVIVCTEGVAGSTSAASIDHHEQEQQKRLATAIKRGFELNFGSSYVDLLTDVVKELLHEDKKQHLQTYGYQLEKNTQTNQEEGGNAGAGLNGMNSKSILDKFHDSHYVKQVHINLNKQSMVTKNWESVYLMLGDHVFRYFYKNYMIFLRTRDDSLVQISGCNIFIYLNDKFGRSSNQTFQQKAASEMEKRRKEELQLDQSKAVVGPDPNQLLSMSTPCKGEFDSKLVEEATLDATVMPVAIKKQVNIKSHKYNLKNNSDSMLNNQPKSFWDDVVNRNRLFYCTHQNRNNAFFNKHILNQKETAIESIAETIFEQAFGFCRIRRSLKDNVMKILISMVRNQRKFDYNYYLKKSCPLPDNWKAKHAELLKSAKDPATRGSTYRELFEYSSSNSEVANFLTEFIYQIMPKHFLKTGKNKKVFNHKVQQFVKFNRFESYTRITILDKFKIDDIEWLQYNSSHKNAKYFKLENEFIWWRLLRWLFEDLLISVLRCYFYCTEKQKEYSRIYYYRKNIWNIIMQMSIEDLLKETLEFTEKKEMAAQCENHNFAPGKLRLIPKGDTFRPIMTFNRKVPHSKSLTTNKKLSIPHMMLKNLKTKMFQNEFGFAVFNYDDIMKKYEVFVNKWRKAGQPKLYFVTMDIEKCYDNVDSDKVVQFLQRTDLLEKEYYILSCIVLKRKNNVIFERETFKKQPIKNYFRHKFHKIGVDGGQYPSLYDILSEENDFNLKRTVIVEQEQRKKYLKKDLLSPISYIAQNNYITFNKKQFKQLKGIPQGLCLSYILSSFYYANLEENALHFLKAPTKNELNCLMRLTDDYLLMTTNKNNAMLVIEQLQKLSKTNYFKMNMKKLKTSFPLNLRKIGCHSDNDLAKQNIDVDYCSWIGISIHMDTLELMPNVNIKKEGVLCTLNVNMQTDQTILWLKKKLKSFLMNNVSFYFRGSINSKEHAHITLNKLYQQAAEKYIACCQDFKKFHLSKGVAPMCSQAAGCKQACVFQQTLEIDMKIVQIIYIVIRAFFKYLVCNIKNPVFDRHDYGKFFRFSIQFFTDRFGLYKNQFSKVYKLLRAKQEKIEKMNESDFDSFAIGFEGEAEGMDI